MLSIEILSEHGLDAMEPWPISWIFDFDTVTHCTNIEYGTLLILHANHVPSVSNQHGHIVAEKYMRSDAVNYAWTRMQLDQNAAVAICQQIAMRWWNYALI